MTTDDNADNTYAHIMAKARDEGKRMAYNREGDAFKGKRETEQEIEEIRKEFAELKAEEKELTQLCYKLNEEISDYDMTQEKL